VYTGPSEPGITWRFYTDYFITTAPVIAADGTIYATSTDDHLYAVNPDGTQKWAVDIATGYGDGKEFAPALAADGTVYIFDNDGNRLRAFDPADGGQLWDIEDLNNVVPPMVADDGTIYAFANGTIYAVDGGSITWQSREVTDLEDYSFGDRRSMALSPSEGRLYAYGNADYLWLTSYFYALNASTGAVVDKVEKSIWDMAVGYDGTLFAVEDTGIYTRTLTALDPDTLAEEWSEELGANHTGPLAIDNIRASIYVVTVDGKLHAFSFSGVHKWELPLEEVLWDNSEPIVGEDGTIYVNDNAGLLYAVSPEGDLLWTISVGTVAGPPAIGLDGTIYVGTERDLVAIDEATKTTYQENSYLLVHKPMSWSGARRYAQSLGGHLVTISDFDETEFVRLLANEQGRVGHSWIGLSDAAEEGTFAWVTGEPLDYTYWDSGEPDSDPDKDYVASYLRVWRVFEGSTPRHFVVEFEGGGSAVETDEDFDDGEAQGWVDDGSDTWSVAFVGAAQDSHSARNRVASPAANGIYQMTGVQADMRRYAYYDEDCGNSVFQADVRKTAGDTSEGAYPYGLRVRADGTGENYYWFIIARIGYYRIGKRVDGDATVLVDWTTTPALNKGYNEWNTLKVVAQGSTLHFYANDTHLETIEDASLSHGQMGLYAYDEESSVEPDQVQFDNVHLWATPPKHEVFLPLVMRRNP
jgi:outer membrane protein assembly factor BamB